MADSEQQDPPLPSPSYCRHTLYQSITDTVNTSVSQYYLVIPLYYDAYSNNIYEIFLLFARLVTYLSCYHPRSHSKSTPDIISSDGCVPVLRRGEECQHLTFKIRKQAETRWSKTCQAKLPSISFSWPDRNAGNCKINLSSLLTADQHKAHTEQQK